jgi:tRNA(fMet)-specific endonuclease VapC
VTEPRYLLDTNICIDLLGGRSEVAARRLEQCGRGQAVTSTIVYAEVMIGAERRNATDVATLFFDNVPPLPFDTAAGRAYGTLPFRRGNFDRLIAAHALSLGLVLVTNNKRDFGDVPELTIENWTVPA